MALLFVDQRDLDPTYFQAENREHPLSTKEMASYTSYDSFRLSKKKKRKLTQEEKEARKQKRKAFWANLGKNIKQGGGAEGLGGTVDNIINLFGKNKEIPEDYSFELANSPQEQEKPGVPTSVFIIGGVVLLGMAGLGYMMYKNKKTA